MVPSTVVATLGSCFVVGCGLSLTGLAALANRLLVWFPLALAAQSVDTCVGHVLGIGASRFFEPGRLAACRLARGCVRKSRLSQHQNLGAGPRKFRILFRSTGCK